MLRRLLEDGHVTDPGAPVFSSATGRPLTRFGIYKRVRQHAAHLESTVAARSPARRITPHVFRHYLPFLTMSRPAMPSSFWRHACEAIAT